MKFEQHNKIKHDLHIREVRINYIESMEVIKAKLVLFTYITDKKTTFDITLVMKVYLRFNEKQQNDKRDL